MTDTRTFYLLDAAIILGSFGAALWAVGALDGIGRRVRRWMP